MTSLTVTQSDIDDVLRRAGLPLTQLPTQPPPPFGTEGFEIYEGVIDPRAYLRPPLTVASSLLAQPLH
jgi:hypothetical protein